MKLSIPFFPSSPTPQNPEGIHCVENCLQMVLGYFEPDQKFSLQEMEMITSKQPEKATWEMQWSIWFANHGYEVKHYSSFDYAAFQSRGVEYIREAFGEEAAQWQAENSDIKEAKYLTGDYLSKIEVVNEHPSIKNIEEALSEGYLVKACVNQRILNGAEGYVGHSVVITGIDDKFIWFHDPGLPAFKDKQVSYKLFQDAMDSFGGEMDAIRKNS